MADDERRSETFIREVDEELRRDQLKELWKRFGPAFVGICVLVVVLTAGYRGWIWWQERQAAQAGDRFLAAVEQIDNGQRDEGEAALQEIVKQGDAGYAALARMRLAGEEAGAGQKTQALADFDTLANDTSLSEPLRDVARIRAALLALDTGDLEGAKARAQPLVTAGNPWRHAAREVLGTAAYQEGDLQGARESFSAIQEDAQTPSDLRFRSGLMIALIDGQLAAPTPAAAPATPETAPTAPEAVPTTPEAAPAAPAESQTNSNP